MALRLLNRTAVGGIIGKFSFDPQEPVAVPMFERLVDAAAATIDARRTIVTAPGIALGWSDDREAASPAAIAQRNYLSVAFDGRLTNATLLGSALGLGCDAPASDAHVVLCAYERWGTGAFERLRGPFACAIWDAFHRRLVLARDHVGIRPLFFALLPDRGLLFGSELRALARDPGVPREWHPAAIDAYLALGYVPAPLTAYRRVSKLEPGHFLVAEGRRLRMQRYWDLPSPGHGEPSGHDDDLADVLRLSVCAHDGDHRVNGLLYSGGAGSTSLLCVAPPTIDPAVTITVDREPPGLKRAERAAIMLGRRTRLETFDGDLYGLAADVASACDEPFGDPSTVSQFAVCLGARSHTDTVLAAHGASTLFAEDRSRPFTTASVSGFWNDRDRRVLYTRAFAWEIREGAPLARHAELDRSHRGSDGEWRVSVRTVLPDSVLPVARYASRHAGLDLRLPLVDVDVVAFAAQTHHDTLGHTRSSLGAVLARELPASLRPVSSAEPAVSAAWLQPALRALVPAVLLSSSRFDARGIVSRPALQAVFDDHRNGRRDHTYRLWSLLMLELWLRQAFDGDRAEEPLDLLLVQAA